MDNCEAKFPEPKLVIESKRRVNGHPNLKRSIAMANDATADFKISDWLDTECVADSEVVAEAPLGTPAGDAAYLAPQGPTIGFLKVILPKPADVS